MKVWINFSTSAKERNELILVGRTEPLWSAWYQKSKMSPRFAGLLTNIIRSVTQIIGEVINVINVKGNYNSKAIKINGMSTQRFSRG